MVMFLTICLFFSIVLSLYEPWGKHCVLLLGLVCWRHINMPSYSSSSNNSDSGDDHMLCL